MKATQTTKMMRPLQAALPSLSLAHPLALLSELATLAENMGGSSGGIYSILLTTASRAFKDQVRITITMILIEQAPLGGRVGGSRFLGARSPTWFGGSHEVSTQLKSLPPQTDPK